VLRTTDHAAWPRRKRTLIVLASLAALIGLVWSTWPRSADTAVLQSYAELEQSAVPVMVVGWVLPTAPRVQWLDDGYVYTVHAGQLGDVTIGGRRGMAPPAPGLLVWQTDDATYALQTTADSKLVQAHVTSLDAARQQLTGGSRWDTPVLYLIYVPAFAVFTVWAARSLLFAPLSR
jgi:hypothetical protein